MIKHTPTEEQQLIINAATDTTDNLMISALAGAAKTSTLIMIAEALPKTRILCLAFNKKIADEMKERLPSNCTSMTLNSLGHRIWGECNDAKLRLDTAKNFTNLTSLIKQLPQIKQNEAYKDFADTLRAIESGKSCGYIPTGTYSNSKRLMNDQEFFAWMDDEPTLLQEQLIREATLLSIRQSFEGLIDFSDQILMPTVFSSMFPSYPLVMVDEAQDLSALNHATLRKLTKKRLIAVGDECQAIYGFRGAHENSMELLQKTFDMKKHILSTSFRCPKKVVTSVLWRAPHMKPANWASDGTVTYLTEWNANTIPETAAIICRNNSPLFNMAVKLLKNGRYPKLVGNDIGKVLTKAMSKFGKETIQRSEVMVCINQWEADRLKKSRSPGKIRDQAACMRVFAEQGETLGEALAYANHIFSIQGPIELMTGHKAKGLEFDTVFFLDEHIIGLDPQELNLRYVIQTRSKNNLFYVKSEDFNDKDA